MPPRAAGTTVNRPGKTKVRWLWVLPGLLLIGSAANAGVVTIGANVTGTAETAVAIAAFATTGASSTFWPG